MNRTNRLMLRVTDEELAKVDELRAGLTRSAFVRRLLADADAAKASDVASRDEALAILTAMARDGKTQAAIALARLLAGESKPKSAAGGDPFDAAAEKRLRVVRGG
jgi:hypothetical protein